MSKIRTKYCPCCKIEKLVTDFYKCKSRFDKLNYYCKKCHNKKSNLSRRKRLLKTENRMAHNEYARSLYAKDPTKAKLRSRNRTFAEIKNSSLKYHYNITLGQYQDLQKNQSNKCAICGNKEKSKDSKGMIRQLSVDHNHQTSEVRGLLCNNCNRLLGNAEDNPKLLQQAIVYLEKY